MHVLETEPFNDTFGNKAQRKRPKLAMGNLEELAAKVESTLETYDEKADKNLTANVITDWIEEARDSVFQKGQSKRIWGELYKVIDSSDVVIHVLDARDPQGTRCASVEYHIKKEARHKQLIFVLNKCDLVPTWVTVSVLGCSVPIIEYSLVIATYSNDAVNLPSYRPNGSGRSPRNTLPSPSTPRSTTRSERAH